MRCCKECHDLFCRLAMAESKLLSDVNHVMTASKEVIKIKIVACQMAKLWIISKDDLIKCAKPFHCNTVPCLKWLHSFKC